LSGIAVALVTLVLLLVVVVSVARGVNLQSSQVVGLLATVGTLAALLVSLLRTGQVASGVGQVKEQVAEVQATVTNHVETHQTLTDDELDARIEAALARRGLGGPPPAKGGST